MKWPHLAGIERTRLSRLVGKPAVMLMEFPGILLPALVACTYAHLDRHVLSIIFELLSALLSDAEHHLARQIKAKARLILW